MTDYRVSGAATSSAITLKASDTMEIYSGGTAVDTVINSGGKQYDGQPSGGTGTASNTTIYAGGTQVVSSGGTAIATTIAGGAMVLQAGAVTSGPITFAGSGRLEIDAVVSSGASTFASEIDGLRAGDTIDLAGLAYVSGGSGTFSTSGVTVYPGGSASESLTLGGVNGVVSVGSDGTGGVLLSVSDGSGGGIVLGSSSAQYVGNGSGVVGSATGTTVSGASSNARGRQFVGLSGGSGTVTSTTVTGTGRQYIGIAGGSGTAIATTISGGVQYVGYRSGGTGTTSGTTILSGAQEVGYQGGSGTVSNTVLNSGTQYVGDDGTGTAINTTINGGTQILGLATLGIAIGTAINTTINGGLQVVGELGTGTASNTTINSGGLQQVWSGGTAIATTIDGGTQQVGVLGGVTAVAWNTTIHVGGTQVVSSGGTAIATTIAGGAMVLQAGAVTSGPITFVSSGRLEIDAAPGAGGDLLPGSEIDNFATVDVIDLANIAFDPTGTVNLLAGNVLDIHENGHDWTLQLDPHQNFRGEFFHLSNLAGTSVTVDGVPCYCPGTLILTDCGEIPVENLAIGDVVVTAAGAHRPIRWLGRRSYSGRFANANCNVLPVTFRAGSLGEGLPRRDLTVSPKHAMFIDGVLVPAEELIDGIGIVQATQVTRVDYIHVELDSHDVLLAEGAASESYLDDDSRSMFHNAGEFAALYPDTEVVPPRYCAPRVEHGFQLQAIRECLARLAAAAA